MSDKWNPAPDASPSPVTTGDSSTGSISAADRYSTNSQPHEIERVARAGGRLRAVAQELDAHGDKDDAAAIWTLIAELTRLREQIAAKDMLIKKLQAENRKRMLTHLAAKKRRAALTDKPVEAKP